MSIFNWIFWKKTIFTSGIVGLSLAPVAVIQKYGSSNNNLEISTLKKNLKHIANKYAEQFTIPNLAKEVFKIHEMKPDIEEIFAQDLALEVIKASSYYRGTYKKFEKEESSNFEKDFKSFNTGKKSVKKFFDSKGGNRKDMQRRELTKKAYELFKKEVLNFSKDNYILNTQSETHKAIKKSYYFDKKLIDKYENWKNIGFFPDEDAKYQTDTNFFNSKFDFINFAHKRWFEEIRPFYVWMSLWKHKDKAHKSELNSIWNEKQLKEKKVDLREASYSFPYFETDDTKGLSSTTKFKKFFKDKVSTYKTQNQIFIPKGYTDDSATAIFVEGDNMYSNLYIRFAAAANYKYQKKLEKLKGSSDNGTTGTKVENINEREKTETTENYKQPTELFLFDKNGGGNRKAKIPIKKEIIKDATKNTKNEIADLVEIKETPWVFIRNRAGIHAVAVDLENLDVHGKQEGSETSSFSEEDVYKHFQYRTLQLVYKNKLDLEQTLDIQVDEVFSSFKKYLEKNFGRLILKFLFSKEDNKFFEANCPQPIIDFKESFQKMEDLEMLRNKYVLRIKLRESLLSTYAKTAWEIKTDNGKKKFDHPDVKGGLEGMLPFKIQTNTEEKKDQHVFEELEKIYDFDFFPVTAAKPQKAQAKDRDNDESLIGKFRKVRYEYSKKVDEYIDKLNLTLNQESSSLASDRIFSNNYYWNKIMDNFLEKTELFNEFLFKYIMKTDYLGKSILGNKGFVNKQSDFEITVPSEYKAAAPTGGGNEGRGTSSNSIFFDLVSSEFDTEKIKKLFGKIDEAVIQSYYSKQLLEKESVTPWDAVKYSGSLLADLSGADDSAKKEDLRVKLKKLSQQAFQEKFVFGVQGFRQKHYKFLTSLTYLVKNNFKELRKYVSSQISYDFDSYILFSNIDISEKKVNILEDSFLNPFLQTADENKEFKKEVSGIKKYLSSVVFKDAESKVSNGFIYKGLYTQKNTLGLSKEDKDSLNANSLYRYGENAEVMNSYVLSKITTDAEFKKIVSKIKEITKSKSNQWVEALEKDQIYVETIENGKSNSEIRTLTLKEKINLLSAILNNVKTEINTNKINKTKYKTTFLVDPENNFNATGQTHSKKSPGSADYEEKFSKDENFKAKEEVKKDKKTKFKLFQINHNNLSSEDKFKTYVNSKLSLDIFWEWVMNTALISEVQDLAVKDLGSTTDKISPFDTKWVESGKSTFIKK